MLKSWTTVVVCVLLHRKVLQSGMEVKRLQERLKLKGQEKVSGVQVDGSRQKKCAKF